MAVARSCEIMEQIAKENPYLELDDLMAIYEQKIRILKMRGVRVVH